MGKENRRVGMGGIQPYVYGPLAPYPAWRGPAASGGIGQFDDPDLHQRFVELLGVHAVGILELELLPFADDHADGGGEPFLPEAALFGHLADDIEVGAFEVDHAGDVIVLHCFSSFDWKIRIM